MVMSDESFALFNKVAATCRAASRYHGPLTKDSHIKDLSKDLLELNANTIDSRGGTSIQNRRKTTTAVKVSIRKSRVSPIFLRHCVPDSNGNFTLITKMVSKKSRGIVDRHIL